MAELIATGTAQADSADFAVVAGTPTTLYIKPASGSDVPFGCQYLLQHKTPAATYITMEVINERSPATTVSGVGTWRVRRVDTGVNTGMDRD